MADSNRLALSRSRRGISVAWAAMAALSVPFIVTGFYQVSDQVPSSLPFAIIALVGIALLAQRRARSIGVGLLVGAVVYAFALLLLLMHVGSGLSQFGS